LRPSSSIPSSESTIIGSTVEHEQQSEPIHSLSSNKRDVIDSWMNNRDTGGTEYVHNNNFDKSCEGILLFLFYRNNLEQSIQNPNDNDTSLSSSSLLFTSSYPPNEFQTSSIIDDELTPSSVGTLVYTPEQPLTTISTDDENDDNHLVEQSDSPTHTLSSSNGHDNVCLFFY